MTRHSERAERSEKSTLERIWCSDVRMIKVTTLVMLVILSADTVLACPSCYGDPGSSEVQGMKWAIISLLGITGTVLGGVGAFFLYLRKRALELNRQFADRLN